MNKDLKQKVDKAIDFILEYITSWDYTSCEYNYVSEVLCRLLRILQGNEFEHEFELPKEVIIEDKLKKLDKFTLLDVKTPERLKKKLNELVDYINKE